MFLLIDYLTFRFRIGRHSLEARRKRYPINLSWEGEYEPVLEDLLTPGDLLFFSDDHSFISWAVQYLTKTDISHVGRYIGKGKVLHATLSGVRLDELKTFFGKGRHVIPLKINEGEGEEVPESEYIGKPYALKSVMIRGLLYLIGVPWRKFRLTYILDVTFFIYVFSALFFGSDYFLPLIGLSTFYFTTISFSFLLRKAIRRPIEDPGEGLNKLCKKYHIIENVKKMNEIWYLNKFLKDINSENGSHKTLRNHD